MVGDDGINFPHKLLLPIIQVTDIREAFANKSLNDIKLPKTQWSNLVQSAGFLGGLLRPLIKVRLHLIKNVMKSLAKSVLIPLRLTAAASAGYAGIH